MKEVAKQILIRLIPLIISLYIVVYKKLGKSIENSLPTLALPKSILLHIKNEQLSKLFLFYIFPTLICLGLLNLFGTFLITNNKTTGLIINLLMIAASYLFFFTILYISTILMLLVKSSLLTILDNLIKNKLLYTFFLLCINIFSTITVIATSLLATVSCFGQAGGFMMLIPFMGCVNYG